MGVNLWGVIHGMEAFLPGMRAHGEPAHIVNTGSMNGIFPSAHSAMYPENSDASTMPGMMPATNSLAIDTSAVTP